MKLVGKGNHYALHASHRHLQLEVLLVAALQIFKIKINKTNHFICYFESSTTFPNGLMCTIIVFFHYDCVSQNNLQSCMPLIVISKGLSSTAHTHALCVHKFTYLCALCMVVIPLLMLILSSPPENWNSPQQRRANMTPSSGFELRDLVR